MNWGTILLIVFSVSLSACAQILLKFGLGSSDRSIEKTDIVDTLIRMLLNPWVISGLGLYFLGAVAWLFVLSRTDVSYAYPFVGLGFILTMVLGVIVLGESVGPMRAFGAVLIVSGIILVARS